MSTPPNPYAAPHSGGSSTPSAPAPYARATTGSLAAIFMVVFVDLLGFGLFIPLLPVYAKQLTGGMPDYQVAAILGGLMVSFSVMQLIFSPVWGRLSDIVGRRPILLLSLAASTACYFMFGVATIENSLFWMFVSRIGAGIAGGTISTAQAYIADVTPPDKRARGMALVGAAFGLGFTFGPLLGAVALISWGFGDGWLDKLPDWARWLVSEQPGISPWPGYLAAGLSAAALVLAWFVLPESLNPKAIPPARKHFDLTSLNEALANPSVGMLLTVILICNFAFAAFESTFTLSLARFLNVERHGAEILLAFAFIGMVQTLMQGGVVRWLASFVSEGSLALSGSTMAIVGYLFMAWGADPRWGGPVMLLVAASVVVSGLGFVYPSINALVSRRTDPTKQGGIMGISNALNSLARIVGMLLGMFLHLENSPAVPFLTSGVVMIAALAMVVFAARHGHDWEEKAAPGGEGVGAG